MATSYYLFAFAFALSLSAVFTASVQQQGQQQGLHNGAGLQAWMANVNVKVDAMMGKF